MPQLGLGSLMGPQSLLVNYFLEISQVDYVDQTSSTEDENTYNAF